MIDLSSRYRKEHPDAPIKDKDEFEEWYESDNQRELRQIFQGQSQMFEVTRELNRKLDEIIGRQERTLSLMSSMQGGGVPVGKLYVMLFYFILFWVTCFRIVLKNLSDFFQCSSPPAAAWPASSANDWHN